MVVRGLLLFFTALSVAIHCLKSALKIKFDLNKKVKKDGLSVVSKAK